MDSRDMNSDAVCPACAKTDLQSQFSVSASQAAQSIVLPTGDRDRNQRLEAHIRFLWGADRCEILKCRNCGFGFSHPFVAGDADFYNLANSDVSYPQAKWEFTRTIEALRRSRRTNASVLEVGAGDGFFLDMLGAESIEARNITAVEYNTKSIRNLESRGYRTIASDIRDKQFDAHQSAFDFVFLFQVVEHMSGLDVLFDRLRYLLKSGGSVFIAVPNPRRIEYQEANDSVLDMPPNHVGRWTPQAFSELSARHGMRVVASEIEPIDWVEFLEHDISYSHIRRTQLKPDGIPARIRSLPRGKFRRLAEAAAAIAYIPARLGPWASAYRDRRNMGGSLWVQLERDPAYLPPASSRQDHPSASAPPVTAI
jgi:2-polyprenyl-3-methyl-5-hydroxy-6-metoxy-1,4-benzoquinol methylase